MQRKQKGKRPKPADFTGTPHMWQSSFSQVNFSTNSSAKKEKKTSKQPNCQWVNKKCEIVEGITFPFQI